MKKTMKTEIVKLVNSDEGKLRINSICYLNRWTKAIMGTYDCLELEFESINHRRYGGSVPIQSRDYEGIMKEIEIAINEFMDDARDTMIREVRHGYNPYLH